jgi:IS1 family transposase
MNRLSFEKRRQILHLLVEGNSVRGTARLADVSPVTVLRYLELAGTACLAFHDVNVRGVKSKKIQADEIWSFNYCKKVNLAKAKAAPEGAGDVWTWTAIDDSKLIVTWLIGRRSQEAATMFMGDLAQRIDPSVVNDLQITTDGLGSYRHATMWAFGERGHFAQLQKHYSATPDTGPARKYSPGICVGIKKDMIYGDPDPAHVSTSYVEKHNQTMRQHMKRYARLTAAHSKKIENHAHMCALYTVWYNFARINSAVKMAPAMAAGISNRLWEMDDLVRMIEAYETSEKIKL